MAKNKSGKSMVGILTAIGRFWTRYFDFMGRATRSEYWFAVLFITIVGVVLCFTPVTISVIALIILFTPFMSLTIRRFRDARISVWLYIVPMLIIFGTLVFQIRSWAADTENGYWSSGLLIYLFFFWFFVIFNFVVACLPSRK